MKDFFNKPLDELLKGKTTEAAKNKDEEYTHRMYLKELEIMREFRRPEDEIRWPNPVRPRWKN